MAELKYGTPQPGDTLDGSVIREQSDDPTVIFVDGPSTAPFVVSAFR